MTNLQQHIIETTRTKKTIEPAQEIRERVNFLKRISLSTKTKGFVLGISGGQDSSLTGKLCQMAVEELRAEGHDATFVAMRLPYGTQKDELDAQTALKFINPDETIVFNIKPAVDALKATYDAAVETPLSDYNKGNAKARMRAMAQYAVAGERGMLVSSTDNSDEFAMGFFTKHGDGAADLAPLTGLNKRQEKELLKVLDAPEILYLKAPTADLLDEKEGQTDEHELGVSYKILDDYLEGKIVPPECVKIIERQFLKTEHKRQPLITPYDTWI